MDKWRLDGWFMDVFPAAAQGAVVWLLGDDGIRHLLEIDFPMQFYAAGNEGRLGKFSAMLSMHFTELSLARTIRSDLFSGEVPVLAVQAADHAVLTRAFYRGRRQFPELTFYDADVPLALRFAARYQLRPFSRCRAWVSEGGQLTDIQPQQSPGTLVDGLLPALRLLALSPDVDPDYIEPAELILQFEEQERRLSLADPELFATRFSKAIAEYDPDIILTKWGDTWFFPWLLDLPCREAAAGLNRGKNRQVVRRKAFSYHTYGKVLHRGQQVHLQGRWHIDQTNAVMYGEYQLGGIFEQARITGLPVQEVARKSPGAGITAMQMITALRRGVLVPYHKTQVESFKTPAQLIASDRGGLVGQPIPGVHYHVAGIDFFSMYPQIMCRFNISPETLLVDPENPAALSVPGTDAAVDQGFTGFIGETLQPLLERRHHIKQMLATVSPFDNRYHNLEACSSALKWLLVVCFGYLGHKHFRWMKIEAHEAVTAFGRDVLLRAKQTAEEMGFRVLYFNVDGLYVQKQGAITEEDFTPLLEAIRARTGLRIDLEGIFRWLAFLPSRVDARVPVANRYFGMMQGDQLKVRGIEIRRHDTPPFIRKAQTEILHLLSRAPEGQPLESMLPTALRTLARIAADVQVGKIPVEEMVISQRLSKELSQYKVPSPAARAAMQLASIGKPMSPGQVVHFLFVRNAPGVLAWRAGLPYSYKEIDSQEYLKLLVRAVSNILQPLGVSERDLADFTGVTGQRGFAFELQKVLQATGEKMTQKEIAVRVDALIRVRN